MSSYEINELIHRWQNGTLTAEQAIGQMLIKFKEVSNRIGTVEKRVEAIVVHPTTKQKANSKPTSTKKFRPPGR